MLPLDQYFSTGPRKTVQFNPGVNLSVQGPWTELYGKTEIDRFELGEFAGAEYTIIADFDYNVKEIIKCIVVAGGSTTSVLPYARASVGEDIIDITAEITDSYVTVNATPKVTDSDISLEGASVFFSATYFKNNHPLYQRQKETVVQEVGLTGLSTFDNISLTFDGISVTFDRGQ